MKYVILFCGVIAWAGVMAGLPTPWWLICDAFGGALAGYLVSKVP